MMKWIGNFLLYAPITIFAMAVFVGAIAAIAKSVITSQHPWLMLGLVIFSFWFVITAWYLIAKNNDSRPPYRGYDKLTEFDDER